MSETMITKNISNDDSLENQKEFLVLGEIKGGSDKEKNGGLEDSSSNCDLADDEIEKLLDDNMPDIYNKTPKTKECRRDKIEKLILQEKGINHIEGLPLGWKVITHISGVPLYFNKTLKVCTLSKPYILGNKNVKKHEIPISAIPCLHNRGALHEEEKLQTSNINVTGNENSSANSTLIENQDANSEHIDTNDECDDIPNKRPCLENYVSNKSELNNRNTNKEELIKNVVNTELLKKLENTDALEQDKAVKEMARLFSSAKVETVQENRKSNYLQPSEVTQYCKKIFKFKNKNIMKFKSWSERNKYINRKRSIQRLTQPESTKLIMFPVQTTMVTNTGESDNQGLIKTVQKKYCMNPNEKSYVSILHEYVQNVLGKQDTYELKVLENNATPFSATVLINEIRYGIGYGITKQLAKSSAAKAAVETLIPEMREKITHDKDLSGITSKADPNLIFFDDISIEDSRVADFCTKTLEPSPYTILETCLSRNFGIADREIKCHINTFKNQKNEFTITAGKHTATVICKNKRDGKQRACQAILQKLHPDITSWGSMLRLYGMQSIKSFKEKKHEKQITVQSHATLNQPNYAMLEKLREKMLAMHMKDTAMKPIDQMVLRDDLPSTSSSNLNTLSL